MHQSKSDFLIKYLIGSPIHLLKACIAEAKPNHIDVAYDAATKRACRHKVIYLLGGNDPAKCPF